MRNGSLAGQCGVALEAAIFLTVPLDEVDAGCWFELCPEEETDSCRGVSSAQPTKAGEPTELVPEVCRLHARFREDLDHLSCGGAISLAGT
jgi:hypothetical protein